MSTHWGYRCVPCEADSPHWFNHGDDDLRDLFVAFRQMGAETYRALMGAAQSWRLEITFIGVHDSPDPFAFLDAHRDHEIVLLNEYDDIAPLGIEVHAYRRAIEVCDRQIAKLTRNRAGLEAELAKLAKPEPVAAAQPEQGEG